jgi:hypothetical protein
LASQPALHGKTRQGPERFGAMIETVERTLRASLQLAR